MRPPYLLIGTITKPQGLRGEVKLHPETGDLRRFADLKTVFLNRGNGYEPLAVESARAAGGEVFLTIAGVTDCDAAEALRGQALYVDRANARPLAENEVFVADLLGAKATDTEGREIGVLKNVLQSGATDVLVFDTPRGPMMAPFLKRLVRVLDPDAGYMVLDRQTLSEVACYENHDSDDLPGNV